MVPSKAVVAATHTVRELMAASGVVCMPHLGGQYHKTQHASSVLAHV
jgi:hypothetical protein